MNQTEEYQSMTQRKIKSKFKAKPETRHIETRQQRTHYNCDETMRLDKICSKKTFKREDIETRH